MEPDALARMPGPNHNVPHDRLVAIRDAFSSKLKGAMARHVLEYRHSYLRLEPGKDRWGSSIPTN